MKRLLLTLLASALTFGATFAQGDGAAEETRMTLRAEMLRMINRDRQHFGLPPVELDPDASSIADAYCRLQIRNRTSGHFTLDGQTPYMRYSFAGGNDGLSENAAAWSANFGFSDRALLDMMRRSQVAMMSEAAPHDGHRKTILDPHATHVGIGVAWEGGEFRIAQEFIRRYVEWGRPLPRSASAGERLLCSGHPKAGYEIEAITVHHEPFPQAISAQAANHIGSYALPYDRREYLPRLKTFYRRFGDAVEEVREEYSDGRRGDFQVGEDGGFAFAVPFPDGPGIYTVVIWVRAQGARETIAASNVSIRVEATPPHVSYGSR
jgi:uncharacterized protein YkwD